ncbi:MAG: bifunctional chorismate mutase/prephenate dehydrogenase [Myxococcales bacterium]|nr:bifunctional chorismate mutase/prephenate dehydrogenase [Myxococcales bacterium]
MSGDDELSALRGELDAIDEELLALAKKRLDVVARIKAQKQAGGRHVFDRRREQEVLDKAGARAARLGLAPGLGRDLLARLIEASHEIQSEAKSPTPASFLLVGGEGRMGKLFGRLLRGRGHRVAVLEAGEVVTPEVVAAADVVMVAVPMPVAAEVVASLAPLVREDALLCDINSLKTDVCGALEHSRGEALGTHPMFGPTVASLRRQKVVLCDVKTGPRARFLEAELGAMGAEVIHATPEEHDAVMAVVQVLTHFGIMTMGRALSRSGHRLETTLPFTSPIYRLELAMVGRLFSQQPELYREIMMSNPRGGALREIFHREAAALVDILDRQDGDAFVAAFEEVRAYFLGFSEEAMNLSDQIIETIMSRP